MFLPKAPFNTRVPVLCLEPVHISLHYSFPKPSPMILPLTF